MVNDKKIKLKEYILEILVVDTHSHLDMPEFDCDRAAVIERAVKAGVKTIVTIGIDLKTSHEAIQLSQSYPGVYAAAGIHPHNAEGVTQEEITKLHDLAKQRGVVALGEMGLDYYRNNSPKETQLRVFNWQLELANSAKLPIIIHCREALADMLNILGKWSANSALKGPKGIIHCFSGDLATARTYIDMGFYLALGGYIGYPSSLSFREVIRDIPLDRLVLETDCPFLPPQQHRGKRNEPVYTLLTLQLLANIKGLSIEEVAQKTTINAKAVLRIAD
jgi:TatD DNase family protein